MITLRLPVPPSVNALYANARKPQRGRYKTKAYRDWITAADAFCLTQKPMEPVEGPYRLILRFPKMRGDMDNRIKATMDYLVRIGLTDDDRYCRSINAFIDQSRVEFEIVIEAAT